MYPICPDHECAHFRLFLANFHIFGPTCTMFSPPVHAGRMDQWTEYGIMGGGGGRSNGPYADSLPLSDHFQGGGGLGRGGRGAGFVGGLPRRGGGGGFIRCQEMGGGGQASYPDKYGIR